MKIQQALNRIRPFIPIDTNDYPRAFVKALTCATSDTSDENVSIMVQKSFSYFKKLGIDDEATIGSTIRRELFTKDFIEADINGEGESFMESEVNRTLQKLRDEHQKSRNRIEILEQKLNLTEQEKQIQEANLTKEVEGKTSELSHLNIQMELMSEESRRQTEQINITTKKAEYFRQLPEYQNKNWKVFLKDYKNARSYVIKFSLWHLIPMILLCCCTQLDYFQNWLTQHNFSPLWATWIIIGLTVLSGGGLLIYRTLLVDKKEKEMARMAWEYFRSNTDEFKEKMFAEYKSKFDLQNPDLTKIMND